MRNVVAPHGHHVVIDLTWQRRHPSDTGWLSYEGRFIRGQVAMYDVSDEQHRPTGEHFFIGYLAGVAKAVTGRCTDGDAACRLVESAYAARS